MKQNQPEIENTTLSHPDYLFLLEISSFLQYGMIGKSVIKKHLGWLHHLYVTPGNVKNKLDELAKLDIGVATRLQLDSLYKAPGAKLLSNVNLIEGFNQLLQHYIQDIQQQQPYIKSYKQQRSFVVKQLQVENNTHTFSFLVPPNDASKKRWIKSIERMYQIVQQLYYLVHHEIADVYFGFDPTKYTVLQPELATALHVHNYYKPLDNLLSRTHSISFYGPKNVLPFILDIIAYLSSAPEFTFDLSVPINSPHKCIRQLLQKVTLPAEVRKAIILEVEEHLKILRKLAIQHHLISTSFTGITEEN